MTMNAPTAIDPRSPELNYVTAGGVRSPGRCYFQGLGRPQNWQRVPGYALSGETLLYRGPAICNFTLTIELFRPEDFIQWAAFSKIITPPAAIDPLKPFLVDMLHPLLLAAEIKTVAIEDPGVPMKAPGADRWVVTIKLMNYRAPMYANAKADKSIPALEKQKPKPPQSAADEFLEESKNILGASKLEAARKERERAIRAGGG